MVCKTMTDSFLQNTATYPPNFMALYLRRFISLILIAKPHILYYNFYLEMDTWHNFCSLSSNHPQLCKVQAHTKL